MKVKLSLFIVIVTFKLGLNECKYSSSGRKKNSGQESSRSSVGQENANRLREVDEFLKKLQDSIWEMGRNDAGAHGINWNEQYEQFNRIKSHLSSGFDVVVYNCTHPTYISLDGKRQAFVDRSLAEMLKSEDECSTKSGHIWHLRDDPAYLSTLNAANQSLSMELIPFSTLLDIFQHLKLCDRFLRLVRHPSAYFKTYPVPYPCSKSHSSSNRFE